MGEASCGAHGGQSNGSIGGSAAAVFQAQLVYYVLQGLEVRKPTESSWRRRAVDAIENGIVAVSSSRIDGTIMTEMAK
jgi:hypothetical protein